MSRINARRSTCLVIPVVLVILAWTAALPAVASTSGTFSSPTPCPGIPLKLQLGTTTPVLLVHGFNEGPGVFTTGSPSLESAVNHTLGSLVTLVTFEYSEANTQWVTAAPIAPALAQCITWLAHTSDTQGGPGRVIIVAHSMGGLAVRCAVDPACVKGNQAANTSLIGLVITLGTPNLGSSPQTAGAVDDTICSWIPACNAFLQLRNTRAAKAMVPGSSELAQLPLLPASIPVDAIAGQVTFTTNLFGSVLGGISTFVKDDGDLVVPVTSALADARQGALHAGPGANSTTVDCGSVPLELLDEWSAASAALKAPAPPVTCWHLSETTDSRWQADIIAAIRPASQALSLRACTPAALSAALAAKDPTNGTQRTLVTSACNSGWALAEVHQPLTLNDGSVVQDTGFAILQQGSSAWSSEGLNDGTCLHAGLCPGYALPPPAVLQLLLQKTGLSTTTTQAELYVNTVFTPGALYKYPSGPPKIGIDNHNWIDSLQWAAGSQGDLVGTGTLHYDDCSPSCAGGTSETFPVRLTASNPQQCTVQLYPDGLGNPSQTVQAEVFSQLDIQALQGNPPSFILDDPALTKPCVQPGG